MLLHVCRNWSIAAEFSVSRYRPGCAGRVLRAEDGSDVGARVVVAAIHRPPHSACKSFSINGVLAYDRPCFPRRTPLAERESLGLPRPCADPASGSERSTPPTFRESERRSPARTGPAPATRPRCGASRRRRAALLLTGQLSECQRHPGICHGLDRTLPCRNHPVRPRS